MGGEVLRPSSELPGLLAEHLDVLASLCALYDSGKVHIAPAIAVNLRVLLHETKVSHALLFQLSPQDIAIADTDKASSNGDSRIHCSNAGMIYSFGLEVANQLIETWAPTLDMFAPEAYTTRFEYWWSDKVIYFAPTHFSRRDIILALANEDGGGHVAKSLKPAYYSLTRDNTTGIQQFQAPGHVDDSVPVTDSVFRKFEKGGAGRQAARAIVRQIGHEVLVTLLKSKAQYLRSCKSSFKPASPAMLLQFHATDLEPRRHHWHEAPNCTCHAPAQDRRSGQSK